MRRANYDVESVRPLRHDIVPIARLGMTALRWRTARDRAALEVLVEFVGGDELTRLSERRASSTYDEEASRITLGIHTVQAEYRRSQGALSRVPRRWVEFRAGAEPHGPVLVLLGDL